MEEPTTPEGQSTTGHFRESDIEFLRAQAKEWLEAVLEEDLDDHTSLEDLLADGTLLYRVSQHIKDDSKFPGHSESSSHSVSASPSVDRKSSMKYQPYASIESFLNVCKEVGLRDVDVFNPSDAVDKKDIRRVCVCLRRLSKKSRTRDIQVPDFDNVKDTLVTPTSKMPREAVRRTQETLQQSSTRSSSRSSANGQVSNETSSSIADLRKDDTENESLKPEAKVEFSIADLRKDDTYSASLKSSEKGETYNKVHHDLDVAAQHREPIVTDSKYTVKVAEPRADHDDEDRTTKNVSFRSVVDGTHGPASKEAGLVSEDHTSHEDVSHDRVDRNGEEAASKSSSVSKGTDEAHTATEPVAKLPLEAPIEEKSQEKPSEEIRKGLFIAHLQGKEPYLKKEVKEIKKEVKKAIEKDDRKAIKKDDKKDDKNGVFPWLPLLGGAVAIAGGIAGVLFLKKRSGNDDHSIKRLIAEGDHRVKKLIGSGQEKFRKLRGSGDSSSDSDDESHTTVNVHTGGSYKVRRGDNLTKIAKESGKKHWREIADNNPSIGNPDLIYPGDRLKL